MKNLDLTRPNGRSLRCLLCVIVLSLMSVASTRSIGQSIKTSTTATITPCSNLTDGPCCYIITFTSGPNPTNSLELQFSQPGCWDWTCFEAQYGAGNRVGLPGSGDYIFTGTPLIGAYPATIQYHICPLSTCTNLGLVTAISTDNGGVQSKQSWGFDGCGGGSTWCPDCDFTNLQNDGFYNGDCFDRACFTKRSGAATSHGPFRVHFIPAWTPCNQPTYAWGSPTGGDHGAPCGSDQPTPLGPDGWTITTYSTGDSMDFTPPGGLDGAIQACSGFCIDIPECSPPVHYTVWIEDVSDPGHDCTPHPSMNFKRSAANVSDAGGATNFPNPVTGTTEFKTTIPFELASDGGDAKIRIFDESGKVVHSEISSFAGSGSHFFYFTAKDLPAGKYFYTIESPLGVTIVKRNLLVVK